MQSTEGNIVHRLTVKRILRIPKYTSLCIAGIILMIEPSAIVLNQVSHHISTAWAVGMFLSAGVCLWGAVTDKWIGEYSGLPLMGGVLVLYGCAALLSAYNNSQLVTWAFGLIILAFGLGTIARWFEVHEVMHASTAGASEEGGSSNGDR